MPPRHHCDRPRRLSSCPPALPHRAPSPTPSLVPRRCYRPWSPGGCHSLATMGGCRQLRTHRLRRNLRDLRLIRPRRVLPPSPFPRWKRMRRPRRFHLPLPVTALRSAPLAPGLQLTTSKSSPTSASGAPSGWMLLAPTQKSPGLSQPCPKRRPHPHRLPCPRRPQSRHRLTRPSTTRPVARTNSAPRTRPLLQPISLNLSRPCPPAPPFDSSCRVPERHYTHTCALTST